MQLLPLHLVVRLRNDPCHILMLAEQKDIRLRGQLATIAISYQFSVVMAHRVLIIF